MFGIIQFDPASCLNARKPSARTDGYPCRVIPFPATQRSVLERIRSGDADVRRLAFGDLAQGYWRPSYHYLRLHWRLAPEAAEDAVQAFFTMAFEKSYVERYDPAKAKFRTFLRMCLDRFVQNLQKAESRREARRRLDAPVARLSGRRARAGRDRLRRSPATSIASSTTRPSASLFARAVESLRDASSAKGAAWSSGCSSCTICSRRRTRPTRRSQRELGLTTSQVTNYLHAARRRFRELALEHLRVDLGDATRSSGVEARELFGLDVS